MHAWDVLVQGSSCNTSACHGDGWESCCGGTSQAPRSFCNDIFFSDFARLVTGASPAPTAFTDTGRELGSNQQFADTEGFSSSALLETPLELLLNSDSSQQCGAPENYTEAAWCDGSSHGGGGDIGSALELGMRQLDVKVQAPDGPVVQTSQLPRYARFPPAPLTSSGVGSMEIAGRQSDVKTESLWTQLKEDRVASAAVDSPDCISTVRIVSFNALSLGDNSEGGQSGQGLRGS
eukprot:6045307-Amphidinium_carterae.1